MKLFVSYSRDDKAYVYELAGALRNTAQHEVWIERDLVGAELWWARILDQIEACDCFVIALTSRAVTSIYCAAEVGYALALNRPVLPLLLKPCDLPPALRALRPEDLRDSSLETALLRVAQALRQVEGRRLQGAYPSPASPPPRPPVPEPKAGVPEHFFEVFAAAEEAAAAGEDKLASRLYRIVLENDPTGLGSAAASRLQDIRYVHSREKAYGQLTRLVQDPATFEGAKAAWRVYVARYGRVYDPNNYASLLSDSSGQTAPLPKLEE